MNEKITKEGSKGRSKLALAIGRGERMIDRFRKGESTPNLNQRLALALECGLSGDEAILVAQDCLSNRPKRTA